MKSDRRRGERGFVLVWMAIMATTLIGVSALSIDWHNRSRVGTQLQKAADAASLGGVVFLPNNEGNEAFDTAFEVAEQNGYVDGVDGTTVTVSIGNRPNQLVVTISRVVPAIFSQVLGIDQGTVTRSSTTEFERPVALGSPNNQYGNDPETGVAGTPTYPNLWGNVFGPLSNKAKGDAIGSNLCPAATHADNCENTTPPENVDHDPEGYFYAVDVTAAGGPLQVEVFDPAFVHVGDNCGDNNNGSNLVGAAALPREAIADYPDDDTVEPSVRYSPDPASLYCTGDMFYAEGGEPPWTTWHLREPDATPHDPTDNPIICSIEFPGFRGDLAAMLADPNGVEDAPGPLASYFRRWYPICDAAPTSTTGTYYLQATTAQQADGTDAPLGGGANRFSIRAGLGSSLDGTNVRVYAESKMGMYANAPAADATFYLARILPADASRALILRFFDIGDASEAGTLQVFPPEDATDNGVTMTQFDDCTYTPPDGRPKMMGPPWGVHVDTQPGCIMTGVHSSSWDGKWVEVRIPIPEGYDCDFADNGCWTRIHFEFPANVSDTTTWTASIEGGNVRIIN